MIVAMVLGGLPAAATAAAEINLPALECGQVSIETAPDGKTVASGFVGNEEDFAAVQNALAGKADLVTVELAPWPACELRLVLSDALNQKELPSASVAPSDASIGDILTIEIESPGYEAYLHVAYFAADGSVFALAQPDSADLRAKAPGTKLTFGDEGPGIALVVTEPAGQELLLVVASERPLFAASRPDVEAGEDFLSALRDTIGSGEAGRVSAVLVPVLTRP